MRLVILANLLLLAAHAFGQLSSDEALQRLQERQRQRQAQANPTTHPAAPATQPSSIALGKMSHQAWVHLTDHQYKSAIPIFDRLLKTDPKDANALEGRGICRYETEQYKQAASDLEQAVELSHKAADGSPSRQRAVAASVVAIMVDNPMRAVKLMRGLMTPLEENDKLDEELQNILGTALWRTNSQTRKLTYYEESVKYYRA